jgi:DNA end-binding protein Ku
MAPRANWKGYLKLSLVSCSVALFPASTASTRVAFHTLNRDTGHRLRRQMIDEVTGDPIPAEDQVRGYEVSKGDYVVVEDDELDAVALESTHTIDIERFVDRSDIDVLYLDAPYYLTPDDRVAEEAFAVIREAMRSKDVVGLARVVMYRRERIVMLEPRGKGLFACLLRYPYEVRQDDAYFETIPDITLAPDMVDLASHIIDRMRGPFEPESFKDRYEEAVIDLVRNKQTGRPVSSPPEPRRGGNVVSLMDALRRSIASDRPAKEGPKAGKAAAPSGKPSPPKRPGKVISAKDMPAARAAGSKAAGATAAAKKSPAPGKAPAARGGKAAVAKAAPGRDAATRRAG